MEAGLLALGCPEAVATPRLDAFVTGRPAAPGRRAFARDDARLAAFLARFPGRSSPLAEFAPKCYAPRTVPDHKRRYERIEIDLPCRIYIPEGRTGGLKFEAFARSQNLGLGGVFLESTFLLKPEVNLWVELGLPGEALAVNGRIAHVVGLEDATFVSGMGVEFLDVDSHARERLLRYFTPERYRLFFEGMVAEFPHLEKELSLEDVSLMVNLWEEWKVRKEGGPAATASGAPEPVRRRR